MRLVHEQLFPAMWLSWAAYGWLSSRGVKPAERIESLASRLMHVVPLVLAVARGVRQLARSEVSAGWSVTTSAARWCWPADPGRPGIG